jgi:hypothetical protein
MKREKAVGSIVKFCKVVNDDQSLEMEEKQLLSNRETRHVIKKVCQVENTQNCKS